MIPVIAQDYIFFPLHMNDRCPCATGNMLTYMDHKIRVVPPLTIRDLPKANLPIDQSIYSTWPLYIKNPLLAVIKKRPHYKMKIFSSCQIKLSKFCCLEGFIWYFLSPQGEPLSVGLNQTFTIQFTHTQICNLQNDLTKNPQTLIATSLRL